MSKRQTIKLSLLKHIKHKELLAKIQSGVVTVGHIVEQGLDFLNLHIRRCLAQKKPLPTIDQGFVKRCFLVVSHLDGDVRKCEHKDLSMTWDLFIKAAPPSVSRNGLNYPLEYAAQQTVVNVETNITTHFFSRHFRYLRACYNLDNKEARELQSSIFDTSKESTDERVLKERKHLPKRSTETLEEHLHTSPTSYLPIMAHMILALEDVRTPLMEQWQVEEKKEEKDKELIKSLKKRIRLARSFSLLPSKKGFIPGHMRLDTITLQLWTNKSKSTKQFKGMRKTEDSFLEAEIVDGKKQRRKRNSEKDTREKDFLWQSFFKIPRIGKRFQFNHSVTTDGVSINLDYVRKGTIILHKFDRGRKKKKRKKKTEPTVDFSHLKKKIVVGVDPGKINLLYMTVDGNNPTSRSERKKFRFTSRQRRREMDCDGMQKKRQLLLQNSEQVKLAQDQLSKCDRRSLKPSTFLHYLAEKKKIHSILSGFYDNIFYRQQRMWSFRKQQSSEDRLVSSIKQKFGAGCVLAYGDWSTPLQTPGMASTPHCRLRDKLRKHFTVIDVPETNTSKTCCKCDSLLTAEKREKDGKKKEIRGLRRCTNVECGVRISRDYNAAINIRRNLLHCIAHGDWMEQFKPVSADEKDKNAPANKKGKHAPKQKHPSVSSFSSEKELTGNEG